MKKSILPTIVETQNTAQRTEDYNTGEISQIKDEWILCSTCHHRSNPCTLPSHKQYHRACDLLGYKPEDIPSHLNDLTFRKKQLLSQIDGSCHDKQREWQKIQHSYEILKANMISLRPYTSRMSIPGDGTCHVSNIDINNKLIKAVSVCSDQNSSWQSDMEDAFTVCNDYGQRDNTCFAGIFDGYHGKDAACTAAQELPILFLDQISHLDPSYQLTEGEKHFIDSFHTIFLAHYKETENIFSLEKRNDVNDANIEGIHLAYAKAFWRMDRMLKLGRKESSRSRWSGCSAVACLIDGHEVTNTSYKADNMHRPKDAEKERLGMLHLANTGNIKAVLCRNGKSHCLTKDHSTANHEERRRILESGGTVPASTDGHFIDGFSLTRGLGFHGDPKLKASVIPAPYTITISLYHTCQFLILASGLWEVLSESEVGTMARELLKGFLTNKHNVKQENDISQGDHADIMCDDPKTPECVCVDHTGSEAMEVLSDCEEKSQISSNVHNTRDVYKAAADFVCQKIVKTAILAGSQHNVTVCLILLPGCQ